MDIKVNQVNQAAPAEQVQNTRPSDGTFKFMLASHIEEAELQTRLQGLMEEITMQGEKLAKRRDVKDMKHYLYNTKELCFATAAKEFQMIEDNGINVVDNIDTTITNKYFF